MEFDKLIPPVPMEIYQSPMRDWVKRFEQQEEVNRLLWEEIRDLRFHSLAQEAAIHALLSVAPDLHRASDLFLTSMDRVADTFSGKHVEMARAKYQLLHLVMTAELARRSQDPAPLP